MRINTVAIVIVNWHRWAMTQECLHALGKVRQNLVERTFHVVVVDNESQGIPSDLDSFVHVVPSSENLGYGAGNNLGVRYAAELDPSPQAVFILNNDATIDTQSMKALIQTLEDDPGAALAAPVLRSPSGAIESAGGVFGQRRTWWTHPDVAHRIDFVSGAALLIRMDAWRRVGGFDERYFHYVEDLDLGWQLTHRGSRLVVAKDASVVHLKSQSSSHDDSPLVYYTVRNQFLFWKKAKSFKVVGVSTLIRVGRHLLPIRHLLRGDWSSLPSAWKGLIDGLRGRTGRWHP